MGLSIGIDFGYTNTRAAVVLGGEKPEIIPSQERHPVTPSVVAPNGRDGTILVGQAALDRAPDDPVNTIFSIKRLMGRRYTDPEVEKVRQYVTYRIVRPPDGRDQAYVRLGDKFYSPLEVSALILAKIKADAEAALSQPVSHAALTVPAYFDDSQREAMRQAGNMAGFQVLRVIDEPVAAAYAFGLTLERDPAKTIIVYDLGGGTFDISILSISAGIPVVEHIEGDNWIGGDRFDAMIMDYVISQMERKQPGIGRKLWGNAEFMWRLKRAAEEAKRQLGESPTADVVLFGTLGGTVDVNVQLERSDFESWIRKDIEATMALLDKAMAGPGLTPEGTDAVLLVGGSTALPMVRRLLAAKFGEEKIKAHLDPMECVALGAAVLAPGMEPAAAGGVTAKPYGIEVEGGWFHIVVPKSTRYPTQDPIFLQFKTEVDGQERIVIPIYQGFDEVASRNVLEAEVVIEIPADKRVPKGTPIDIGFWIDENGALEIVVRGRGPLAWLQSGKIVRAWEVEGKKSGAGEIPIGGEDSGAHPAREARQMSTAAVSGKSGGAAERARFLAACLLNAGRAQEAEQVLRADAGPELKPTLALACARQGKLEEAVAAWLEILEKNPGDQAARQSAVTLLHRLAVRSINAKDWAAAGSALGEVLKLDPANRAVQALLASIENVLPVALLKAGKRQEAAEAWEKAQRQRPDNGQVAHSLALLYYYWALALEDEGRGPEAESLWHKAIACWVLVRYSDSFWADWARQRRAIYPVTEEVLAALRCNWAGDLGKKFRHYGAASETTGTKKEAARRLKLEMAYWVEQLTACVLSELRKIQCPACKCLTTALPDEHGRPACEGPGCRQPLPNYRPAHAVPVSGPIFLKQAGAEAGAQKLLAQAAQLPNGGSLSARAKEVFRDGAPPFLKSNADVLRLCLSPYAPALAMLVHGRPDEAVAALGKLLPGKAKDAPAEGGSVMLLACLERGKQLATGIPELPPEPDNKRIEAYVAAVKAALEAWKKGHPYRGASKELAEQLGERVENLGIRGGNEFYARGSARGHAEQYVKAIELLTHGINLLEFAIGIEKRERMSVTVSVLYADRGLHQFNKSKDDAGLSRAVEDLEKALKHSPQNARAKELLDQAMAVRRQRRGY